jgi:5-methylcytosine-specific restriction endonuclease McrA
MSYSRHLANGDAELLLQVYDYRCWYCGTDLATIDLLIECIDPDGVTFRTPLGKSFPVFDHQIPKSKGGSNDSENLVPCCNTCNCRKGAKDVEQYRAYVARKTNRDRVSFFGESIEAQFVGGDL